MRPDIAQFSEYLVGGDDSGRSKLRVRHAGKGLCLGLAVFGLVVGLQSTSRAADSLGITSSEPVSIPAGLYREYGGRGFVVAVNDPSSETAAKDAPNETAAKETAATDASKKTAAKDAPNERIRDHSARDPKEMALWFLEAAAILAVLVSIYKLLGYWVRSRRGNS